MSQFEFLLEGAYILSGELHQQCGQPKTVASLANGTNGSVAGEHPLGIGQDYALITDCDQIPDRRQFKDSLQFRVTMEKAEAQDGWAHCICSQKARAGSKDCRVGEEQRGW